MTTERDDVRALRADELEVVSGGAAVRLTSSLSVLAAGLGRAQSAAAAAALAADVLSNPEHWPPDIVAGGQTL